MAKKFQFRLEVVGDVRRRARDEAARAVGRCVREALSIEQRLGVMSSALREVVDSGRTKREDNLVDIAALRTQQYYSTWLHGRITEAGFALTKANQSLSRERERLTLATAQFKAIENLRERKRRRHEYLVRREEQAVMDEVGGRMRLDPGPHERLAT
jgi:flagellar export protein FliJ